MNITGESQDRRRAELRRWREGDRRAAPPATAILPPSIEEMRKGRTLAEVWNIPRYLLPYSGK